MGAPLKLKFILALIGFCASLIVAAPAEPGFQSVTSRDGSSVSIRYFGDEHYHYAETSDGILVTLDSLGNYVYVGEDGLASGVIAKNVADRSPEEKSFLKQLNQEAVHQKYQELKGERFPDEAGLNGDLEFNHVPLMSYNQEGTSMLMRPTPESWTKGERWFPVLLVGTSDMDYGDSAAFYDYFNKPGYNVNRNIGSVRDYFVYQSDSQFIPHFDVYPIKIDATLESFGSGDNYDEGKFTSMVLDELAKREDFLKNASKYCYNRRQVDGFVFLYPGMEEDAMKQSSDFWSHQYYMQTNGSSESGMPYNVGGYYFDKYLFTSQFANKSNNKKICRMGTVIHEFSHIMGLMDHYSKDKNKNQIDGPAEYDIMSLGMYNGTTLNEGNVPMGYSAFEKEALGWMTLKELAPDSVYSLRKLSKMEA